MKTRDIKTALIGCGRIGFLLEDDPLRYKPCTHYGGALTAGLSITSACDLNETRLSLFGSRALLNRGSLYTDYKKLLSAEKPDIVIISTWTDSHSEIAIQSCLAGAKVIVLEKPFTAGLKSAKKLIETARKTDAEIIVNHERRFDARYRKVREIIALGKIGAVKSARGSILTGGFKGVSDIKNGGGPLLHDGTHMIDIVRFLFGEIKSVSGRFFRENRNSGFEDHVCAVIYSHSGQTIFIEAGGGRKYFSFELEISGTEGKIIIGNGVQKLFISKKSKLYTGFYDLREVNFPVFKKNNCFTEIYTDAINVIKGKGSSSVSSPEDGYMALQAVHSIYLSSSQNGKEINLPVKPEKIDLKKIFNIK